MVYFPPGFYQLPNASPTLHIYPGAPGALQYGVTLLGDGIDVCEISFADTLTRDTLLTISRDNCRLQGLTFTGNAAYHDTSGSGIVIGDSVGNSAHVLRDLSLRDVRIRNVGQYGLVTMPTTTTIIVNIETCRFEGNGSPHGLALLGHGTTTSHFRGCTFSQFKTTAVRLMDSEGITFENCVFEGETDDQGPFVYAYSSNNCSITNGWFEDDTTASGAGASPHQWFVQLDRRCHGFRIDNSTFRRDGRSGKTLRQPRAVQILGISPVDASISVMITNPEFVVPGTADTTGANFIDIASDTSEVYLIGGVVRDSLSALGKSRRVIISDRDRLMTFGGTRCLKLMRWDEGIIVTMPSTEKAKLVYNKRSNRADLVNDIGWVGIATGIK